LVDESDIDTLFML